ncbi:PKD domain-containing protein [Kitasatospora sp. RG8]|uniref:PKD domain-containing protein n=1 Tax=Kitasatospora sp. RG8 TaxID=2820815 RepID=UPI001ADFA447|nr:PKD domain-containing protein [Kitasatospora sp. RG8]MBP0453733.1 PKD domain-containing protein [Kitasatospora sp. RG8]
MRLRHAVGLSAAVVSAVVGLPLPAVAAEPAAVVYVDNSPSVGCDDHGTGTAAKPYCTVQAAADAALPGQTVQLAPNTEQLGDLVITRSGEIGKPITFRGSPFTGINDYTQPSISPKSRNPIRLTNVHDVVVTGLGLPTVELSGSSRVELSQNWYEEVGESLRPAVAVSGQVEQITIERSVFYHTRGLVIGAGAQHTTIAANQFSMSAGVAIDVTDAPDTVVNNNTLTGGLTQGLALKGASAGSAIVNNIVNGSSVSVSAASATGTRLDYNIVHPVQGLPAYTWADRGYQSPAELNSATGQGAHDIDHAITFENAFLPLAVPTLDSNAAIDSADPLPVRGSFTDLVGNAPTDHPLVANGGPNSSFRDRGSYEVQGLLSVELKAAGTVHPAPTGPGPLTVDLTAEAFNQWGGALTYTFDFGDGSAPLTTPEKTVRHTYLKTGGFVPKVTVIDGRGGRKSDAVDSPVTVTTDSPMTLSLTGHANSQRDPLGFQVDATGTTSPWAITSYTFDFGDGTTPTTNNVGKAEHAFAEPGTHTVKVTVTDDSGQTRSGDLPVTVNYDAAGFKALSPTRVLDTRWPGAQNHKLGPGETWNLNVRYPSATGGATVVPPGATAVVLNLTATEGTQNSFLSAYPTGGARPITSNVNFGPNQDVANLVTVPVGPDGQVTIRNNAGTVHVVGDVLGYYSPFTDQWYQPVAPARLLDTRTTGTPLGQDSSRRLKIAGQGGVPADATSVVLNITSTESSAKSFFTAYPAGSALPVNGSNLNTVPGRDIPNQVVVPLGGDGSIDIYNHVGTAHAVVDVFGYYTPNGKGRFVPVVPTRLLDSRDNGGAKLGPGGTRTVNGVPAGAMAAAVNLTATETEEKTHLIAWATGSPRPDTSNLNASPSLDVPNHATVPVDAQGRFDLFNNAGNTHVVADLFGYYQAW